MATTSNAHKPIIFVGATDAICGEAIRIFAEGSDVPIVLADADKDALQRVAAKLPGRDINIRTVDLHNPNALREAIMDAALVVQGAQPYSRTSKPVLTACIDAKVPYLDYSDDVPSTQASLELHARAKTEGVPCYINCGASPGLTNLLAAEIAESLDTVDSLDICWVVGEESGALGREVLAHLMDITGGPCLTWADGKATIHENWVETSYAPVFKGSNDLLYENVHPEPITLPRRFPNVSRIRTLGALSPAPSNGLARGLGAAANSGSLPMDAAIDFLESLRSKSSQNWSDILGIVTAQFRGGDITLNQLYQLVSHGIASLKPWNLALWGMLDQVRKGECTASETLKFLVNSAQGKAAPRRLGLLVRGVGTRNGSPAVAIRRTPTLDRNSFLRGSMATAIGASCAAFALMALDLGTEGRPGVYCPEDWADSETFLKSMEKLGCPRDQLVESIQG